MREGRARRAAVVVVVLVAEESFSAAERFARREFLARFES